MMVVVGDSTEATVITSIAMANQTLIVIIIVEVLRVIMKMITAMEDIRKATQMLTLTGTTIIATNKLATTTPLIEVTLTTFEINPMIVTVLQVEVIKALMLLKEALSLNSLDHSLLLRRLNMLTNNNKMLIIFWI